MKAKEYQQRALDIQTKKLGRQHIDVAKSYSNFALIYIDSGDLNRAKECQELALNIQLHKLDEEHIEVAKSYRNLALIHQALRKLTEAKEQEERWLFFDYIIFVSLVIFALYYIWRLLKYLNILLNTLTAIYLISRVLNL